MSEIKDRSDGKEPENRNTSWIKEREETAKQRAKRVEKSFSRIDKILGKMKNESTPDKEKTSSQEKARTIVWPEMHSLIEKNKEGQADVSNPDLINLVKKFTNPVNKHLINDEVYLKKELGEGCDKFQPSDEQWTLVAGEIDKRLDEINETALKKEKRRDGYLRRSTKAVEESTRRAAGEQTDVLPRNKEQQRKLIIGLVEQLESNDLPLTSVPNIFNLGNNSIIAGRINTLLSKEGIIKEVEEEARARMKLQHCAAVIEAIPGSDEKAKEYIFNSFSSAESKRYLIEGRDLEFLFKKLEVSSGLKIADAFSYLQEAWMEGVNVDGKRVSLSSENLSAETIEVIEERLVERLGGDRKAVKSLQLAKRIAKATLETSVWNKNTVPGDPLAECIYFRNYRESRAKKAQDRGPEIHIRIIEGFGTSFLRSVMFQKGKEKTFLFLPKENVDTSANEVLRIKEFFKRNRGEKIELDENGIVKKTETDKGGLLNAKQMEFSNILPGSYMSWLSKLVGIFTCKSLLFKSTWDSKDINKDEVEKWISPFEAADPGQKMRLRVKFVLGLFDSTFSDLRNVMDHGWDGFSLQAVFAHLTDKYDLGGGKSVSFLTEAQLNWVRHELKRTGLDLESKAGLSALGMGATKRIMRR